MIGIITAMPIENDLIVKQLLAKELTTICNICFTSGTLGDKQLVVATSSIGKVNAAICTQLMLAHFPIDYLINLGISGSLSAEYQIGDILIGEKLFYHDVRPAQLENWFPFKQHFTSHQKLLDQFKSHQTRLTHLLCGDGFIESAVEKKRIKSLFGAAVVDMESTAVAHTCAVNNVPFIAIRSVSDLADDQATQDYDTNERLAATTIQNFVVARIKTAPNLKLT